MIRSALSLTAALMLAAPAPAFAETEFATPEAVEEIAEARTFESDLGTMPYRLIKPAGFDPAKKYPVFLAMHGAGGRGSDNLKTIYHSPWALHAVASAAAREKFPCFIVVPQCPDNKRWVDQDWNAGIYAVEDTPETAEMKLARAILAAVMAEFEKSADATRVYVGGFSMGGYGTWDLVARHPELFAAAVPVCGGAAPGRAKAIAEAGVKVWAFHGADDGVVPPAGTQAMVKALKEAGAAVEYTEFPKTGHNAWTPAWQKPEVLGWVFAQKRDAAPR